MTDANSGVPPCRCLPSSDWEHFQLYSGVREAIASLPTHFRSTTQISGILATDLHTLNTVLGATIEEQVVRTLNQARKIWDPKQEYESCRFDRQAQTFPDVLLRNLANDRNILLGIELKGWYLLAKEGEPSLRFQTTAAACGKQDLVVVFPWVLENILSGSPVVFEPFIESARYAAEYRNYHWSSVRKTKNSRDIRIAKCVSPYPNKADHILDTPAFDRGGNFGRLARTGFMDDYIRALDEVRLCGIEAKYWRSFFSIFRENTTDSEARVALENLRKRVQVASSTVLQIDQATPLQQIELARSSPARLAQSAAAIADELERLLDDSENVTGS